LGAGFIKNSEQMQRLALGRRENWLRGMVLHINDKPCAFWIGSVYKQVFHSEATGYDPAYRKYELGTVVFLKLVEDLCAEKAEAIDFGLGDALYKRRFGDESWQEGSVRIFASSFKGTRLNLLRTVLEGSALATRRLAQRIGIEQRLKTLWRKKLAGDPESRELASSSNNTDAAP
jgi:CelD/BcsL family acetyltransferase involved in cellulose biosynthesis